MSRSRNDTKPDDMRDSLHDQEMKDRQTPQEVAGESATAQIQREEATAIAQARRVTAEYMEIQDHDPHENKYLEFMNWNPQTDYNQLMMVVEKAFEDGLISDRLCLKLWGNGEYVACPSVEATPHPVTKDLRIAILLCITKAIESLKK